MESTKSSLSKISSSLFSIAIFLLFIAIAFLAYSNILNNFFLSDDFGFVYNLSQKCGVALPKSLWECVRRFGGALFFRPLTSISFYLDYLIWQLSPFGYHATNVFLHSMNGYLVFRLSDLLINNLVGVFNRIEITRLPVLAGFLFLILPSHVEAVTWISARSDLLATCLILLSFIGYVSTRINTKVNPFSVQNQANNRIFCSLICFGLALGAKESAMLYPGLLVSFEIYGLINRGLLPISFWQILGGLSSYGLILAGYLGIRYLALGVVLGGYASAFPFPEIAHNLLGFLARTILPPMGFLPILLLSILGIGFWGLKWRSLSVPKPVYGLWGLLFAAYLLFLLPVINLSVSLDNTQEERFLYLPSVFLVIILAIALSFLLRNHGKRLIISIILLISLFYGISLYHSNRTWQTAAEISQSMVLSLQDSESASSLYVVNLPDHYRGAYLFRNSFARAVDLFAPRKFSQVQVLSWHSLENISDSFLMPVSNHLQSANPNLQFYFKKNGAIDTPIDGKLTTAQFSISDYSEHGFRFWLPNRQSGDRVIYYSAGKMQQIPDFLDSP